VIIIIIVSLPSKIRSEQISLSPFLFRKCLKSVMLDC